MKQALAEQCMPDYWDVISCDSTRFLSSHTGYDSRLYHGEIEPNVARDAYHWARSLLGGLIRLLLGALSSVGKRSGNLVQHVRPYVLLITVGGPKYAGEERQMVEACQAAGLDAEIVYLLAEPRDESGLPPSLTPAMLTAGDYGRALVSWLWRTGLGSRHLLSRDAKRRSLFVETINGIRQDCVLATFARRIIAVHGAPRFVFSLAPSGSVSVTIVNEMKRQRVLTAGIRTQTIHADPEYLAINTDILFCKGAYEQRVYNALFRGVGPKLEEGCVLSLPEPYDLEPLELPQKYALLLGTSRRYDHTREDGRVFEDKLCDTAATVGLPAVLKMHNLAADWGGEGQNPSAAETCAVAVERDMRRNRELIDRASLVASGPSTLLYYALLKGIPIVIVESYPSSRLPDEFLDSPIHRVRWEDRVDEHELHWPAVEASAGAAKLWFERSYFLERNGAWVIEHLLRLSSGHDAGETGLDQQGG